MSGYIPTWTYRQSPRCCGDGIDIVRQHEPDGNWLPYARVNTNATQSTIDEAERLVRVLNSWPDLLEAAGFVENFISEHGDWFFAGLNDGERHVEHDILDALRTAIAKAGRDEG